MLSKTKTTLLAGLLAATLLTACGPRVSQENYDRIQNDMTSEEVTDILGKPTEVESFGIGGLSASSARWVGKTHTITVTYGNDRVKLKTYAANEKPPEK